MYYFVVLREEQVHIEKNLYLIKKGEVYVYFEVITCVFSDKVI